MLKDTLHSDGSKTYETLNYGFILISNPEFVKLIEKILKQNHTGWSYVPQILKYVNEGKDINKEYRKVLKILD